MGGSRGRIRLMHRLATQPVPDRPLGHWHGIGERAVEIVQVAAIAMAAGMGVGAIARIPLSFPTYTGIIGRAASRALEEIGPDGGVREAF